MKKLMITAAIVCAAVVGQAASIRWNVSGVTTKETSATTGYAMYIFASADSRGIVDTYTVAEISALAAKGDITSLASKAISAPFALSSGGKVTTSYVGHDEWVKNDRVETFAIIFNDADATKATYYNVGLDTDAEPDPAPYVNNFGTDTQKATAYLGGTSWAAVSAVPEPTSGLLLLLGVAGLALRRRRA